MPQSKEQSTLGQVTQMSFASDDLFRAIRMMSSEELIRWYGSETRLERLRILEALIGVRGAMK